MRLKPRHHLRQPLPLCFPVGIAARSLELPGINLEVGPDLLPFLERRHARIADRAAEATGPPCRPGRSSNATEPLSTSRWTVASAEPNVLQAITSSAYGTSDANEQRAASWTAFQRREDHRNPDYAPRGVSERRNPRENLQQNCVRNAEDYPRLVEGSGVSVRSRSGCWMTDSRLRFAQIAATATGEQPCCPS